MRHHRFLAALVLLAGSIAPPARADGDAAKTVPAEPPKIDLAKQATLYVVGYAHLDTEWRWAYPQTIREFIANTLHHNFALFEKYPSYVFNFSGSRRYQMMQEYYPEEFKKLKGYVAQGRWFPCGSSVDENDANVPSGESFIRHVMYGNRYFRRNFGVASEEFMLPDCFGFPAALPSLLAHCGVKGFSTQKLTWGLAIGKIPFKVGTWEGPDGRSVVAALDPGAYVGEVKENLATSEGWAKRIDTNGEKSGVFADYHYYGTGDQGGAPKASSVDMVEQSVHTDGHTKVVSGPADWMFRSITPEMAKRLPVYKGELELTEHSAGSITSEAYMKRWNRKNELLADAAERAALMSWWTGADAYPSQRLEDAWTLVLGSQMHDILPGTSLPKAYEYAWNDEVLASNVFADVLQHAVGGVADSMDTRAQGTPVVIYNPLSMDRDDVAELTIPWTTRATGAEAIGPDGRGAPVQIVSIKNGTARVLLRAHVPSAGFAVYDIRPVSNAKSDGHAPAQDVRVTSDSIENERFLVKIDNHGDVASIHDKSLKKEVLSAPARLGLHYERPRDWPAWNQDWADRQKPAIGYVSGAPKIRVAESGPVRGTLQVEREYEGSKYVQNISLSTGGAGDSIVFETHIDWNERERSLRATFPLAAANATATYDIQTGVIERGNATPAQFEYAAHQWMDTTDKSSAFGISILNDCKYASDKPDDATLRLTLLYTPGVRGGYQDQGTQDIGRHEMKYAIAPHHGDWRAGGTPWKAARLNQPLRAFVVPAHDGPLGKSLSLLSCDNPNVMVVAAKKAEDSDEIVVRLRELTGRNAETVHVRFASDAAAAREIDGQEREIGTARIENGALAAGVHGYGLRAYAVKVASPKSRATPATSTRVPLAFDADVVSTNAHRDDGAMEQGRAYPAEQFPLHLTVAGVAFDLGSSDDKKSNALSCKGQSIALPSGDFDRAEILAASSGADARAIFLADETPVSVFIPSWRGYVGQWDNRRWGGIVPEQAYQWTNAMCGLDPGYIKNASVAWFCSHHHTPHQDEHYQYCYLFRSAIPLPHGATKLTLPNNPEIKIFAISAVHGSHDRALAAAPLRDMLTDRGEATPLRISSKGDANDAVRVQIEPTLYYREDSIRYTTDGSDPTPDSPLFTGSAPVGNALWLGTTTTIKAAAFDDAGDHGPIAMRTIEVHDTTPPRVKEAWAEYAAPRVHLLFSEPIDVDAARSPLSYALSDGKVSSVELAADACSASLILEAPLPSDRPTQLRLSSLHDLAGNTIGAAPITLAAPGPVFKRDVATNHDETIRDVKNLPIAAGKPWSISMWVRASAQPEDRTIIAGFGRCDDGANGTGRYLTKFASGIQFWTRNGDVPTRTQLDLNEWQMLTATCDGSTLRVYKNTKQIAEQPVALSDDEAEVHVLPVDPWERKRTFEGDLRDFTIWSTCLAPETIKTLHSAFKPPADRPADPAAASPAAK
jgi:alpha-mannosidase